MSDNAPLPPHEEPLPEIPREELTRRVIYAMSFPAIALARRFRVPLKETLQIIETAYYHELKKVGLRHVEAADLLGVSSRKVAMLSKQLKELFGTVEVEETLPRKIEFLLWAGPQTQGRIVQFFAAYEEAEILAALDTLVAEERAERVERRPPEYRVHQKNFRLYRRNWIARIDGLQNLLGNLTGVIGARFFDGDDRAFARTLSFRLRTQDLHELQSLYEDHVWRTITELEARVQSGDRVETIDLSLFWAPSKDT